MEKQEVRTRGRPKSNNPKGFYVIKLGICQKLTLINLVLSIFS